jgi:FkbM family methyltransferase
MPRSETSKGPLLNQFLAWVASLIPRRTIVRILRGPLRGKKWIKGAGPNAYWVGSFEVARLRIFEKAAKPGAVVYDIGANVGIYSLLASIKVGPLGMVYAFEPLERNLYYLRRHLELNVLKNCVVVDRAVGQIEGSRSFSAAAWEPATARLDPRGEMLVPATTIDNCVYGENSFRPPHVLKIDVEHAELEVLEGASRTLLEFRPAIFLEVHSAQLHADCLALLLAKGYRVEQCHGLLTAV